MTMKMMMMTTRILKMMKISKTVLEVAKRNPTLRLRSRSLRVDRLSLRPLRQAGQDNRLQPLLYHRRAVTTGWGYLVGKTHTHTEAPPKTSEINRSLFYRYSTVYYSIESNDKQGTKDHITVYWLVLSFDAQSSLIMQLLNFVLGLNWIYQVYSFNM